MFYVDSQGNAVEAEYEPIAEKYEAVITQLLERAGLMWNLD